MINQILLNERREKKMKCFHNFKYVWTDWNQLLWVMECKGTFKSINVVTVKRNLLVFLRLFPCKLLHFPLERQEKSFFVLFSKMLALNVGVYGEPRGVQYQTFNCFILFTFASAQPHLSMRVILFRSSVHILCFKGTYGEHIFSVVF